MDWDLLSKVALAVLAVAAAAFQIPFRPKNRREQIKVDIEILKEMPPSSRARDLLSSYIEERVSRLVEDETERRRNLVGAFNGVIVGAFGAFLAISSLTRGEHPYPINLAIQIFATFIIITGWRIFRDGISLRKRDGGGRIIE
ncbi:hypothetical protein [Micromonospora sp. NBC_01813]|uniref:hypothetical protein n=1 Tax=Micromonospora sp. NBC_01813 TaxID=2975988 RepID=UPI002DDA01DD|nr:hypothetical protein [Micromonospora sp. NBC_01813]WSA06898.1 hypothetical protein OG958_21850 [Micromonospora sp. NBC_01813]